MDDPVDDLRALWQDQPAPPPPPPDELRAKADKFRRTIAARNLREQLACALVAALFTYYAIVADAALVRLGCLLEVAAAGFVAWYIQAHGASAPATDLPCLAYHRRELEHQRDLLRRVWRWYIGPMLPGVLVLVVARAVAVGPDPWGIGFFVLVFGSVGWLNKLAAAELQRQLDALPPSDP